MTVQAGHVAFNNKLYDVKLLLFFFSFIFKFPLLLIISYSRMDANVIVVDYPNGVPPLFG